MMIKQFFIWGLLLTVSLSFAVPREDDIPAELARILRERPSEIANVLSLHLDMAANRSPQVPLQDIIIQYPIGTNQNEWLNEQLYQFTYDEDTGKLSDIHVSFWNNTERDWFPAMYHFQLEWLPDNNLSYIHQNIFIEHFQDDWENHYRYTHQYNENNQIEYITGELYDNRAQVWETERILYFNYDEYDSLRYWTTTLFDCGGCGLFNITRVRDEQTILEVLAYTRISPSYDENGRVMELIEEAEINDDWYLMERYEHHYHRSDQSGYEDFQKYINNLSLYLTYGRIINKLPYGNLSSRSRYIRHHDVNEWYERNRDIVLYDVDYLPEKIIYMEHFIAEDRWANKYQSLFAYNELLLPDEIIDMWSWGDAGDPDWRNDKRTLITYEINTGITDEVLPEKSFSISNYPNPFNPQTTISFDLPVQSEISLKIYNIKGELVRNLADINLDAGRHGIVWNGEDDRGNRLGSGVYTYRLLSSGIDAVGKMLMLK